MIAPPSVKHIRYSRGDDLPSIASECANAIHLSKGESALLRYYACQSSGFRPSLQHIADQTGLSRSQVARCRNGLVSKGLCLAVLGNQETRSVIIDWSRAKLYATLDPKKTRHGVFASVAPAKKATANPVSLYDMRYAGLDKLIDKLSKITDEQYAALVKKIRAKKDQKF